VFGYPGIDDEPHETACGHEADKVDGDGGYHGLVLLLQIQYLIFHDSQMIKSMASVPMSTQRIHPMMISATFIFLRC